MAGEVKQAREIGDAISEVPVGTLIKSLGLGIAEAQLDLDKASLEVAKMMSGRYKPAGSDEYEDTTVQFGKRNLSLLELGFTPNFYQFIESTIDIRVSIKMRRERRASGSYHHSSHATTIDAKHSSTYRFSVEASSRVRTKLVPVPPPAVLEERIRRVIEKTRADVEAGG